MAAYWYIANAKLKFEGVEDMPPIDKELWRGVVENDNELFWFENTSHGNNYFSDPYASEEDLKSLRRTLAHMDINRKIGHGQVQFNYNNKTGHIPITHTRETLNRIEKYYKIANKLNAKLFKNGTWINEKQLDIFKVKYAKKK
ncbi:MAG: hypothetical protein DRI69_07025 [Bacteroidetes bacterium]|nr:MAG: hypothetical protein DRI69_07025 [Bacteroidota bacterium]